MAVAPSWRRLISMFPPKMVLRDVERYCRLSSAFRTRGCSGFCKRRDGVDREHVAHAAETRDDAGHAMGHQRLLVHRLALVDVGDVNFDFGSIEHLQGIEQS